MWESKWVLLLVALGVVAVVALALLLKWSWRRRRLSKLIEGLKGEDLRAELRLLLGVWPRDPNTAAWVYAQAYFDTVHQVIRLRSTLHAWGQLAPRSFAAIQGDFWGCVARLETEWEQSGASVPDQWRSYLRTRIGGERNSLKRVVELHARGYWGG